MNDEVKNAVVKLRAQFVKEKSQDASSRVARLRDLRRVLTANEEKLLDALSVDLAKCFYESYLSELSQVYSALNQAIKKTVSWQKTKKFYSLLSLGVYQVEKQAYGVVLIMVPFNYPLLLSLVPLISALAAGNCVLLRFSKETPTIAACLRDLIASSNFCDNVAVIVGNQENRDQLLQEKYDYIFFTGSQKTGQMVMKKAAENFTPVTLELGGKSPCIVDDKIDVRVAARRILFGKLMNAGQTCIAPDYLLVNKKVLKDFTAALIAEKKQMVNELEDPTWPKLINEEAYFRVKSYLADSKLIFGGGFDDNRLKMELSLVVPDTWKHPALHQEIFGPLWPLVVYTDYDELLKYLNVNPDPLAMYIFSNNQSFINDLLNDFPSGGVCINDTLLHIASNNAPFGGVGSSGIGHYHGYYGFTTFCRPTTILKRKLKWDFQMRFRPYNGDYKNLKRMKI